MKKCPTCEKTFEDSMRFCQVDGTPLLDDAPAFDPYATIVGGPISAPTAEPVYVEPSTPADPEIHYTVGSIPISEPDDLLDLPSNDPLKTMYVSDAEMQSALSNADIMEIPPIEEVSQPAPPSFIVPEAAPAYVPEPPPTPFEPPPPASPFAVETVKPAAPVSQQPEHGNFEEAATMIQPSFQSPFDQPSPSPFDSTPAPVAQWTPPPAPEASWQNQEIGSNTPFQPPPTGTGGQNKTLAVVSLVLGILGIFCCGLLTGIPAIITGYMARGKVDADPLQFGGRGLATAGMILGGVSIVLTIVGIILQVALGAFNNIR